MRDRYGNDPFYVNRMRYYYGFFRPISLDKTDDDDDFNYASRVRTLRRDFTDYSRLQNRSLHSADLDDDNHDHFSDDDDFDDHEGHTGLFGNNYFDLSRKVLGLPKVDKI